MGWQAKPRRSGAGLGGEVASYLERRTRELEKNAAIVDAWEAIVPPGLKPFCRLDKRAGNVLFVAAMPGPYMHQVKVMAPELLEAIKRAAPRCGIAKIQVVAMEEGNSKS